MVFEKVSGAKYLDQNFKGARCLGKPTVAFLLVLIVGSKDRSRLDTERLLDRGQEASGDLTGIAQVVRDRAGACLAGNLADRAGHVTWSVAER